MNDIYEKQAEIFKVLGDRNRLMIIDMLSCGELCACKILERLRITQPTLSHHMKTLTACGLVNGRKEGSWTHYSLNKQNVRAFKDFLALITKKKENCICL